jgi:hypothetical protein
LLDEPLHVFDSEKFRQGRPRARCLEIVGGIRAEMLREGGEPVESPDRGDGTRNRARREPFVHQPVDKTFEVAAVQALNRNFDGCGEFSKPLEIATVALESVIGEAPFDAQVREIRIDEIMGG